MVWIIGACLIVLAVISVVVQLGLCRSARRMFEHAPPLNAGNPAIDPAAEAVTFVTEDGLNLRGSLYKPRRTPRGLVLFFAELGGTQGSGLNYCQSLVEAGFALLSFDFRNHGQSDALDGYEPLHWLTEHEHRDLRAVLKFVDSRDDLRPLPLGVFGVSRGGGAALIAAAESPRVACVACEGAYSTSKLMSLHSARWVPLFVPSPFTRLVPRWQIEITLAGARLYSQFKRRHRYLHLEQFLKGFPPRPVLLIAGQRDSYVLPEMSEALRRELPQGHVDVVVVPKARHNKAREVNPAAYDARLAEFFLQHMPALVTDAISAPEPARPLAGNR